MSIFLLSNETSDDEKEVGNDYEDDELPSFINEGRRREAQERAFKKMKSSKYRSTLHVSPTSCICEQTNSQAKFIMTDLRKHMDQSSLELLLLLKLNANMWDVNTIHEILLAQQRRIPIPVDSTPISSSSFVTPSTNSSSSANYSSDDDSAFHDL